MWFCFWFWFWFFFFMLIFYWCLFTALIIWLMIGGIICFNAFGTSASPFLIRCWPCCHRLFRLGAGSWKLWLHTTGVAMWWPGKSSLFVLCTPSPFSVSAILKSCLNIIFYLNTHYAETCDINSLTNSNRVQNSTICCHPLDMDVPFEVIKIFFNCF